MRPSHLIVTSNCEAYELRFFLWRVKPGVNVRLGGLSKLRLIVSVAFLQTVSYQTLSHSVDAFLSGVSDTLYLIDFNKVVACEYSQITGRGVIRHARVREHR